MACNADLISSRLTESTESISSQIYLAFGEHNMPTPADEAIRPPTPPIGTSSSRASFASCPPEEDREPRAPREARVDTALDEPTSSTAIIDGHATAQLPTPDRDEQTGGSERSRGQEEAGEKAEHVEDAGIIATDSPSPIGSPDAPSESDARLAQSMATAGLSSGESAPQYLYYPPLDKERVCA